MVSRIELLAGLAQNWTARHARHARVDQQQRRQNRLFLTALAALTGNVWLAASVHRMSLLAWLGVGALSILISESVRRLWGSA